MDVHFLNSFRFEAKHYALYAFCSTEENTIFDQNFVNHYTLGGLKVFEWGVFSTIICGSFGLLIPCLSIPLIINHFDL